MLRWPLLSASGSTCHEFPLNCVHAILWVPGILFGECRETLWLLRENIPDVSSDQSTNPPKNPTKGALTDKSSCLLRTPSLAPPCWGNSLPGNLVQDCDLQIGLTITCPNAVVLAWVSSFPFSPSQQHLVSHLYYTAGSWELHSMGHTTIQIQVNISFLMNKPRQSCSENKVCDFGVKNLNREPKIPSLSPAATAHLLFPDSQPFMPIPTSTKPIKLLQHDAVLN